jgi:DNA-binding CsgD family transcriptional regulator
VMDISQNTIETHMRIALKKIRTQLEAYLEGKR